MRPVHLLLAACLGTLPMAAQKPPGTDKSAAVKPKAYVTQPSQWRLEVSGVHGGWTTDSNVNLSYRVVDPQDPDPPKDDDNWNYVDPDLIPDESTMVTRPHQDRPWRHRRLIYWWNGEKHIQGIEVGRKYNLDLTLIQGENRLELWQPDSNRRVVRTLWGSNTRNRLLIRLVKQTGQSDEGWWGEGLQVVEPDHTESIGWEPTPSGGKNRGDSYVHPTPIPGTYTVRWFDGQSGVDGYEYDAGYSYGDKRPRKVVVEVTLDAGTENERRWRFERLVMPGTKRVTLGSFDVED